MNQPSLNEGSKWLEVLAVVLTGLLHLVFKNLGPQGLFIALSSVFWIAYIAFQVRRDSGKWKNWGFRRTIFGKPSFGHR